MSKGSRTSLIVLTAALTACADESTSRMPTAPAPKPSFNEAPGDVRVGYTPDGPFDAVGPTEDASTLTAAAAPQAASGSRASGHVGFPAPGLPGFGIASEQYSFTALSTDAPTFAAKGQYEVMLTGVTGNTNKIHGDVVCMATFGNTTRVAGQITKLWRNGVQVPIPPNATHNIWVVVDNGEGSGTPDLVSLIRFANAAAAQTYCATGFASVVFPNQEGNVQVRP